MQNWYTEREQAIPKTAGRGNWENKTKTKGWLGGASIHQAHIAGEGEALEEQRQS